MTQSFRPGGSGFQFRLQPGHRPSLFSILIFALVFAFLLVFGVGILMIAATVAVLFLPWLWWKRRQWLRKMQQGTAGFSHTQQSAGHQGITIEGEVLSQDKESLHGPKNS